MPSACVQRSLFFYALTGHSTSHITSGNCPATPLILPACLAVFGQIA